MTKTNGLPLAIFAANGKINACLILQDQPTIEITSWLVFYTVHFSWNVDNNILAHSFPPASSYSSFFLSFLVLPSLFFDASPSTFCFFFSSFDFDVPALFPAFFCLNSEWKPRTHQSLKTGEKEVQPIFTNKELIPSILTLKLNFGHASANH